LGEQAILLKRIKLAKLLRTLALFGLCASVSASMPDLAGNVPDLLP
jgi:hypothetical protein